MQKIDSLTKFEQVFQKTQIDHYLRNKKTHLVEILRTRLKEYEETLSNKNKFEKHLEALMNLQKAALEYCSKKSNGSLKPIDNPKYLLAKKIFEDTKLRLRQIQEHALNHYNLLHAPHHEEYRPITNLPTQISKKLHGTGVNIQSKYRLENHVAKHGMDRRMHAGTFLINRDITEEQLLAMSSTDLYGIIKRFKHEKRFQQEANLAYFTQQQRDEKLLTLVGESIYIGGTKIADTSAALPNGRIQSSAGYKEVAIYACDMSGNFYVHLDTANNAGKFQHSSIMSGKTVTCAGTLIIKNGRLLMLSNESGHYTPDLEDLHDATIFALENFGNAAKDVIIIYNDGKNKDSRWILNAETMLELRKGSSINNMPNNKIINSKDCGNLGYEDIFEIILKNFNENNGHEGVMAKLRELREPTIGEHIRYVPSNKNEQRRYFLRKIS